MRDHGSDDVMVRGWPAQTFKIEGRPCSEADFNDALQVRIGHEGLRGVEGAIGPPGLPGAPEPVASPPSWLNGAAVEGLRQISASDAALALGIDAIPGRHHQGRDLRPFLHVERTS